MIFVGNYHHFRSNYSIRIYKIVKRQKSNFHHLIYFFYDLIHLIFILLKIQSI